MLNNKKKKKGFTLIELIIVIAIIAILAAIAIPKFGEVRKNANIKADIATAKNVYSAVSVMLADDVKRPGSTVTLQEITDSMGSKPVSKLESSEEFSAEIEADGDVVVKIGDKQVYPEPTTTNEWYPSVSSGAN